MNSYRFSARGHPNISGTHPSTVEFTKDADLTKKGDCIIGVDSDFDAAKLSGFLSNDKLIMRIEADGLGDEVVFIPNHGFSDDSEIVIRKSDFESGRTLGIRSDKGAKDIDRELIERIKDPKTMISVTVR